MISMMVEVAAVVVAPSGASCGSCSGGVACGGNEGCSGFGDGDEGGRDDVVLLIGTRSRGNASASR